MNDKKMTRFVTLVCARQDRQQHVKELVEQLISAGTQLLIVVTKPPFFESAKSIMIGKRKNSRIYAISKIEEINIAVHLFTRMRLWHKPIFHVLIGDTELKQQALEALADARVPLTEVEQILTPHLIGFLDPIDDVLECYGTPKVQEIFDALTWRKVS